MIQQLKILKIKILQVLFDKEKIFDVRKCLDGTSLDQWGSYVVFAHLP